MSPARREEPLACAPAGTAENPSQKAEEIYPLAATSKVNRQNAQRRIAEGRSKKQGDDRVPPRELASLVAQQLVLVSNALEYGQRHGSGVCVSIKMSGCKTFINLFPRASSSGGGARQHSESRGHPSSHAGRTPDRSWRARTTENGERPREGIGRQEDLRNLGGSQSPPRLPPHLSSAQGNVATGKKPTQVLTTPQKVQWMSETLAVDESVAVAELRECGGDFERAEASLKGAIQAERVREETPKGADSTASQPEKKHDGKLGSAKPTRNVVLPCVPHNTAPVQGDSSKPIYGNPGSTSSADGACGNPKLPASYAGSITATGQGRGGAGGTGRGGGSGSHRGGRGKGSDVSRGSGSKDNPKAG